MEEYVNIRGNRVPRNQLEKICKSVNCILAKYPLSDLSVGGDEALHQFYGNLSRAEREIQKLFQRVAKT
jgi:metallophosphoesterase superfamily enzyme